MDIIGVLLEFSEVIIWLIIVSPVIILLALGLRQYLRRRREDKGTRISDIFEFQLLFIGLYTVSFAVAFLTMSVEHGKEYYEPIYSDENHYTPFAIPHRLSLVIYDLLCAISFAAVCLKWRGMPPLALSLCIVFFIMGIVVNGLIIAQHGPRSGSFGLYAGQICRKLNIVLLVALIVTIVWRERRAAMGRQYKNKFLNRINAIIGAPHLLWALILLVPVFVVITLILLLFGQEYDSLAKVFTETTTWNFSRREHPPYLPRPDGGHYLCTVAACGHTRVVKPLRLGLRRGETIVVNRQLMVANAFEEMIMRRFGRAHRCIRFVYDRCGYPVSKHITNKYASDAVYVLMKPLEYFFLVCLYLFELRPEEAIKRQYL